MDFKNYLEASKSIVNTHFSVLTEQEINRIEKQLRLETKFSKDNEKEDLLNFIKALRNHKDGLDFLVGNPNICCVLFNNPKKINKSARIQVKDYKPERIKLFFETCLLPKLIEIIGLELQSKKYIRLLELVKLHRFLPDEAVLSIIKGLNSRLNEIQPRLDAKLESVSQDLHDMKTLVIYLDNKLLKSKWQRMSAQASMNVLADLNSNESTLEWINSYFKVLGETPKTEIEKEKRKEKLRGCNCAMGFIILMFLFFGGVIFVIKLLHNADPKPQSEKKEQPVKDVFTKAVKDLPFKLIKFNINEFTIENTVDRPKTNSGNLGTDFIKGNVPSFIGNALLINQTTSDMIVFSTSRKHPIAYLKPTSRYVRAGDSIRWTSYLGTRVYIGKKPKLITQNNNEIDSLFRFLKIKPYARELIKKEFYFKGKLIIKDSLDKFYLNNKNITYTSNLNMTE